ncbi:hypothetical protein AB0Y20_01265 [Heyndrickxia oleronia]|uniref:hypothetical protein n=1 Tax=Heyndrickxia oleronia TaxID=38875 RepID=UPI003F27EAFC
MPKKTLAHERIGLIKKNNSGSVMEIIKYKNKHDVWVRFENGYVKNARYMEFKKGTIRSPYDKTVFDVGFLGEGKYKPSINGKLTNQYKCWIQMLKRSYDDYYKLQKPTYNNVIVANEWHNFQNFAKWYDENYYEVYGEKMNLDKDILIKGNKVYSPETCVFVPANINSLFLKSNASRGDLPIGVYLSKRQIKYGTNKIYGSKCNDGQGKAVHLGFYTNQDDAFYSYKRYKEKVIKRIANVYINKIPNNLYEALMNYEVEITD